MRRYKNKSIGLGLLVAYLLYFAPSFSIEEPCLGSRIGSCGKGEDAPIPMADFDAEPSAIVHGCVNVIYGQFSCSSVDLTLHNSVDPVKVERHFNGCADICDYGTLSPGWSLNHMDYVVSGSKAVLGNGAVLDFNKSKDKMDPYRWLVFRAIYKGVTNSASGYLSGQTNVVNYKLLHDHDVDELTLGNGTVKKYVRLSKDVPYHNRIGKEKFPSGNQIDYSYIYTKKSHFLESASLKNSKNRSLGKFLFFNDDKVAKDGTSKFEIKTETGRWAKYEFKKYPNVHFDLLDKVSSSDGIDESYDYYIARPCNQELAYMTRRERPNSRYLGIKYFTIGDNQTPNGNVKVKNALDLLYYRVKSLMAPAGTDEREVPIYQFVYNLNLKKHKNQEDELLNGSCKVYNALNHPTEYFFNKLQRLEKVCKFNHNNAPYTTEWMYWGDEKSKECMNLKAHALEHLGQGVIFTREYEYDTVGNVIKNTLRGNLSGHSKTAPSLPVNGVSLPNGSEGYVKNYIHSKNGLNLLLEESDGTTKTAYVYESRSNRLKAKFEGTLDKWKKRHFYKYNEDAALIQEIFDDGSSKDVNVLTDVTERHIVNFTQSTNYPSSYPLVIERKALCMESGKEILVHRVENTYNDLAKITKQEHFGSDGNKAYTLLWKYDIKGNLIEEIDAKGNVTTLEYDAHNNCTMQKGPHPGFYQLFTYDFMNRLIREEEVHQDGMKKVQSYRYDTAGRRIASVDHNGNETKFEYDTHGRVTKIISPLVYDENMIAYNPTLQREYDPMGNVTCEIDSKGHKKTCRFNLRGQVAETLYPDGTNEKKFYSLDGHLTKYIAPTGVMTTYLNDYAGRPIKTTLSDETGTTLFETTAEYSGFHLIAETNAMGMKTVYRYYPDGNLKSKESNHSLTEFIYDSLGRVYKTKEYFGSSKNECIVKAQEHDLLNRVIEERTEDALGAIKTRVSYTHNVFGKIDSITTYSGNKPATTITEYDSHGTAIVVRNDLGHETFTTISYKHINSLGQYAVYSEVVDPEGNIKVTELDALGREFIILYKNHFGQILKKVENFYDRSGNLARIVESTDLGQIITTLDYDSMNRPITTREALGLPEQKTTKVLYNNKGQKATFVKPDGQTISYSYDSLGRLLTLKSSDQTIHYSYHYDKNHNLVKVDDHISGKASLKSYDLSSHITSDTLGNGLTLNYTYDLLGRPIEISLPDGSFVAYTYDTCFMKSVIRKDKNKKRVYSHEYFSFDLSGKPMEAKLIQMAGTLKNDYDLLGRTTKIVSDHWSETILEYDRVGNILKACQQDTIGKVNAKYTYDDFYQIKSEEGSNTHTYTYDYRYNRQSKDGMGSSYNGVNQLLVDGIYSYQYDLNGNMVQKVSLLSGDTCLYTYDALDRLMTFQEGTLKAKYTYDDINRRLSKTLFEVNAHGKTIEIASQRFLYQGLNEIGSYDQKGNIKELRLLGLGRGAEIGAAIAIETYKDTATTIYAPIHDHTGSVACLINASDGEVAASYRYTAFGEELFDDPLISWRFSSKRIDQESGFIYFGNRYYSPANGRWITPDPIGKEGGPNLYAYVLNNPHNHIDLYGHIGEPRDEPGYFGDLARKFTNMVNKLREISGLIIEKIGHHLSPHSYIQNAIEFSGHCLSGKNPSAFVPTAKREQSEMLLHQGNGCHKENTHIIVMNGILTDKKELQDEMSKTSFMYKGATVHGLYTPSHGFLLDVLETGYQKLGIRTQAQKSANNLIHKFVSDLGENKHHATLLIKAHSRACETVHNFCYNIKQRTHLYGYGGARQPQNGEYLSAVSHVASLDPVPLLADPIGYIKGRITKSMIVTSTKGFFAYAHNFAGETYMEWRRYHAQSQFFKHAVQY